jgi:undecaprenyl diphosphate synthase
MIYWLYEKLLSRRICILPGHICFMLTGQDLADAPGKIAEVASWCSEISESAAGGSGQDCTRILGLTFHISTPSAREVERYLPVIRQAGSFARIRIHVGEAEEVTGEGMDVVIAAGKSGREEIAGCIRRMAEDHVSPENVDEAMIESYLTFRDNPDIVIKTGSAHLTDFLIWQSVYSELFFTDVNWKYFRRVDFLRILRDYQSRSRRYGA